MPNAEHKQQDVTFISDDWKQQLCYLNQNFVCKDLSGQLVLLMFWNVTNFLQNFVPVNKDS